MLGSSLAPDSIVFFSDLKIGLGSRFCISASEKTLAPKTSLRRQLLEIQRRTARLVIGDRLDRLETSCAVTHGNTTPTLRMPENGNIVSGRIVRKSLL